MVKIINKWRKCERYDSVMNINYDAYDDEEDELDEVIVNLQKMKRMVNQKRSNR